MSSEPLEGKHLTSHFSGILKMCKLAHEKQIFVQSRPKLDHSMTFGIANVIRSNLKDATLEVRVLLFITERRQRRYHHDLRQLIYVGIPGMWPKNQRISGMFLQKPKDENTLPQMRRIYFCRKASKPHGQSRTHSSRQTPPSVLIRRNSLLARREIKKDNKPDTLIRLPRERQLYFERTD